MPAVGGEGAGSGVAIPSGTLMARQHAAEPVGQAATVGGRRLVFWPANRLRANGETNQVVGGTNLKNRVLGGTSLKLGEGGCGVATGGSGFSRAESGVCTVVGTACV